MHVVKLGKIDEFVAVALPSSLLNTLNWHEDDVIAIEIVGDQIVLTHLDIVGDQIVLTHLDIDSQDAWSAYQQIEPHYRNANPKLGM